MHPQYNQAGPRMASNELEDYAEGGGIYPGGTGIVEECCYRLWDYNGSQPKDSICAVYLRFRPLDGSNDNKHVEQFYSVGQAVDFVPSPDGGSLMSLSDKEVVKSTNWGFFYKNLREACGLERGRLSTPMGVRALQNAIMTLVQVDQPHREGLDQLPKTNAPGGKEKKSYPRKTLVPTRATFTWDPNYANATRNLQPAQMGQAPQMHQPPQMQPQYAGAPNAQQMAPPQMQQPMQQQQPAFQPGQQPMQSPAPAGNGDNSLAGVIRHLLQKNGGSLSVSQLPAMVVTEMGAMGVDRTIRVNVSKEAKDMNALTAAAQANGWTLAGDDLIG